MGSKEDEELDKVAEKLRGLQLERRHICEKEEELLRELTEIRRKRKDARQRSAKREHTMDAVGVQRNTSGDEKKDRLGNVIRIGDRVEFLTAGRLAGKYWTVYEVTDKRVLCERNNGTKKTHRGFNNVRRLN